jgi:SHS2 domain-containing protein
MGMMALIRGADLGGPPEDGDAAEAESRAPYATGEWRRIAVEADDAAGLLVAWLRELLWLHEARRFDYQGARFQILDGRQLIARVGGAPDARPPVREIKGVTYHGLRVEPDDGGWRARVIFDV